MPRDRLALEDEVDAILQQLQGLQERLQAQHRAETLVTQAQSKAEAASAAATESTQIARAALAALRKAH
jgi:hypothetical protein